MRQTLRAAATATAVMIGTAGASLAATPQPTGATVRQDVAPETTIIDSPTIRGSMTGDPTLSNDQDDGD